MIATYTGKSIDPLNPSWEDIDIVDIAHGLSLLCRYAGQCSRFYSVAEHCIIMAESKFLSGKPLVKLLHDAPEAYLGDMIRAIKIHLPDYREMEKVFLNAVALRFNIENLQDFKNVKTADNIMLVSEAKILMTKFNSNLKEKPNSKIKLRFYTPKEAELKFLKLFEKLYY